MDDSFFASNLLSEFQAGPNSPQSDYSMTRSSDDDQESDNCGAVNLSVREEDEAEENFIDVFMRKVIATLA